MISMTRRTHVTFHITCDKASSPHVTELGDAGPGSTKGIWIVSGPSEVKGQPELCVWVLRVPLADTESIRKVEALAGWGEMNQ